MTRKLAHGVAGCEKSPARAAQHLDEFNWGSVEHLDIHDLFVDHVQDQVTRPGRIEGDASVPCPYTPSDGGAVRKLRQKSSWQEHMSTTLKSFRVAAAAVAAGSPAAWRALSIWVAKTGQRTRTRSAVMTTPC